ncbi:hypothetical protein [Streptomyces smyrnaeus]|uniref:hypothetical protein n=1 Tax=Streptomyces smyrnaeus TaxID=1387713 RepID=UPI0036BDAF1E
MTATLTGAQARVPRQGLKAVGWHVAAENALVLARIDHEGPYQAEKAAQQLTADGITVEITPQLRKEIDEDRTSATSSMIWCTPAEIREISDEAQKIYDDIRHGRLLIHAHPRTASPPLRSGLTLGLGLLSAVGQPGCRAGRTGNVSFTARGGPCSRALGRLPWARPPRHTGGSVRSPLT